MPKSSPSEAEDINALVRGREILNALKDTATSGLVVTYWSKSKNKPVIKGFRDEKKAEQFVLEHQEEDALLWPSTEGRILVV